MSRGCGGSGSPGRSVGARPGAAAVENSRMSLEKLKAARSSNSMKAQKEMYAPTFTAALAAEANAGRNPRVHRGGRGDAETKRGKYVQWTDSALKSNGVPTQAAAHARPEDAVPSEVSPRAAHTHAPARSRGPELSDPWRRSAAPGAPGAGRSGQSVSAGDRVSGARDEKQFWRQTWPRPPGRMCLPLLTCTLKTVRKARFRVCVFYTTRENNSNNKNVKEIKKKIGSREVGMALKVVGTRFGV